MESVFNRVRCPDGKTMSVLSRKEFEEYMNPNKRFVFDLGSTLFIDKSGYHNPITQLRFSYETKNVNNKFQARKGIPIIPINDAHTVAIELANFTRYDRISSHKCEIDKSIPYGKKGEIESDNTIYHYDYEDAIVLKSNVFEDLRLDIRRGIGTDQSNLGKRFLIVATKKYTSRKKGGPKYWHWCNNKPYIPIDDLGNVVSAIMSLTLF